MFCFHAHVDLEYHVPQLDNFRFTAVGANFMDGAKQKSINDEVFTIHCSLLDYFASCSVCVQYGFN